MASINFQLNDGVVDDGSRSPIRSRGVSSRWSRIVRGDSDELSPPVISVTVPAASPSSSVQEQIGNSSSDWHPSNAVTETESSPDGSGTECQPEGSDNSGGGSNAVTKPVWSKPSNDVVQVVSLVMDAGSWPALGESTKASPISSSSESLQALSDGSLLPALPMTGNSSPSPLRLANTNPTSNPNHVGASGQRSIRRGGGNSGAYISSNGGVSQRSPTNQDSISEAPHNTSGRTGTVAMDSQRGGYGSHSNSGNEHHHQRNSYRRGNSGNPRGNQEWNQHRSVNNMPPHRGFRRGYIRPPVHTSPPFIPPMHQHSPMRPYVNNVIYPDVASQMYYVQGAVPPEAFRHLPLVAPMYLPVQDPVLHAKIMKQIDYYFSDENLVKDAFLRRNMDEQGWVPVNLIAGFKKVLILTNNIQLILDAMRASTLVEVQGDKLRRRNEWMKWVLPSSVEYLSGSGTVAQLQVMALDGGEGSIHSSQQERAAVA